MKFVLAAFDEFNPSALPFRNQPAALDPPLNISLCVVIRHSFKNRGAKRLFRPGKRSLTHPPKTDNNTVYLLLR